MTQELAHVVDDFVEYVGTSYLTLTDDDKQFIKSTLITQMEGYVRSTVEHEVRQAERDYYHRLQTPVVNLDDETKNCARCGYDHEHRNSFNQDKYCMADVEEARSWGYIDGYQSGLREKAGAQ